MTWVWLSLAVQGVSIAALWLRRNEAATSSHSSLLSAIKLQQETIDDLSRYVANHSKGTDLTLRRHAQALADQASAITRMTDMIREGQR